MALLHIAYERLVTAIHNEATIENYRTMGRRLGRLLYEGRWFDPQSLMLREPLQRWVGAAVTGEVTVRLRRGDDYTIARHHGPEPHLPARAAVDGAQPRTPPSVPLDRIGQLHDAQPRHRRLAPTSSTSTAAAAPWRPAWPMSGCWVPAPTLGAPARRATPALRRSRPADAVSTLWHGRFGAGPAEES